METIPSEILDTYNEELFEQFKQFIQLKKMKEDET